MISRTLGVGVRDAKRSRTSASEAVRLTEYQSPHSNELQLWAVDDYSTCPRSPVLVIASVPSSIVLGEQRNEKSAHQHPGQTAIGPNCSKHLFYHIKGLLKGVEIKETGILQTTEKKPLTALRPWEAESIAISIAVSRSGPLRCFFIDHTVGLRSLRLLTRHPAFLATASPYSYYAFLYLRKNRELLAQYGIEVE